MRRRDAREQLALSLHGVFKHIAGGPAHPQRDEWAWDELPSRMQERWMGVVDAILDDAMRARINGIAGREARDAKEAA